jgi:HK97 gp10 family phage protein
MDFAEAAAMFAGMVGHMEPGKAEGLEKAAKMIEEKAKAAIGTHEYGWPPLTAQTIARKANGDTPLLETGTMRDSIEHTLVSSSEAEVGSNDPVAEYQELGTPSIPPRSFLAETGRRNEEEAIDLMVEGMVGPLSLKPD